MSSAHLHVSSQRGGAASAPTFTAASLIWARLGVCQVLDHPQRTTIRTDFWVRSGPGLRQTRDWWGWGQISAKDCEETCVDVWCKNTFPSRSSKKQIAVTAEEPDQRTKKKKRRHGGTFNYVGVSSVSRKRGAVGGVSSPPQHASRPHR